MTSLTSHDTAASIAIQGGGATLALAFFKNTLDFALPFLFVAFVVIFVDLYFGIKAAAFRGEHVRISRAFRRTVGKCVEYLSWVILAATLAVAFDIPMLSKIILGVVIFIEGCSIFGNWMELRGKKIKGLDAFGLKILEDKTGHDTSMIKIEDIDKKKKKSSKKEKEENESSKS